MNKDIDYELVINDLSKRIALLIEENAILKARVNKEMKLKEKVEQEYMKVYTELSAIKTERGDV